MFKKSLDNNVKYYGYEKWENLVEKKYLYKLSSDKILDDLKSNGMEVVVLVFNNKFEKRSLKDEYLKKILNGKRKQIFVYMADDTGKIPNKIMGEKNLVFKSHIGNKKKGLDFIPVGVPNLERVSYGSNGKSEYINVFFSGNMNSNRRNLHRALSGSVLPKEVYKKTLEWGSPSMDFSDQFSDSIIRFTQEWAGGMGADEYQETMWRSKIALCPAGFRSSETFRHCEALRAGCAVISERLPPSNPFYQTSAIIQVDSAREMVDKARELLSNKGRLEHLMQLSRRWWERKCSPEAVAEYVYEKAISYYGD